MIESITSYFAEIPSSHRALILVLGLVFFSLIESAVPLMSLRYDRWKHAAINIFFTLTTIIVNFVMAFALVWASDYVVAHNIGTVQWLNFSIWPTLIVGLLLMDLIGAWFAHWCEHHVVWMWKFHVIHHTDKNVDTTTANRHHPGESVIRFTFTIIAAVIVGAPMWLVFLYQSMSVVLSQFNHANITLPAWLNKLIVPVFCTPDMHRVHHHHRMPYSDTNYGNIFSFWDRIFRTYSVVDNNKLIYGVDTYYEEEDNKNIWQMLKIPFQPYRHRIHYENEENL